MASKEVNRRKAKQESPQVISYTSSCFSQAKQYFGRILSLSLVLLGSTLIFVSSANNLGLDLSKPFLEQKTLQNRPIQTAYPTTVYIPRISKVLEVGEGEYKDGRWKVSLSGVSYLKSSAVPGKVGNSVIYGHNLPALLGNLPMVSKQDMVYVVLSDGGIVKYSVAETKEVTPESIEILNPTNDSRLTLYTCSGFLDSARFVVVAKKV